VKLSLFFEGLQYARLRSARRFDAGILNVCWHSPDIVLEPCCDSAVGACGDANAGSGVPASDLRLIACANSAARTLLSVADHSMQPARDVAVSRLSVLCVMASAIRRKLFFFEKKNQKTFARCRGSMPGIYQKR
jgi:hypothetical protein